MSVINLSVGSQQVALHVPAGKLVQSQRQSPGLPLAELQAAVAASLESPVEFPTLRRALTPEDHIAIVLQNDLHGLPKVLQAVLEHVLSAGLSLEQVTLLTTSPVPTAGWMTQLPAALQAVAWEQHVPGTSKMAYLASTKEGRRIYLNRTIVDADQVIILSKARFDPVFGIAVGLSDLFPGFSDESTMQELTRHHHHALPLANRSFPEWKEVEEVGWQLGMPFVLCLLEGTGDSVHQVLAGTAGPVRKQAEEWLRNHQWLQAPYQVDLIIGTVSGLPAQQTLGLICEAAYRASHLVHQGGQIALLSEAGPHLPPGAEVISQAESAVAGLTQLRKAPQIDSRPWWYLAHALEQAKVYLSSNIQQEVVESLFMVPLDQHKQVQNLIDQAKTVMIVEAVNQVHAELARHPHS